MNLRDQLAAACIPGFESNLDDEPSVARVHIHSDLTQWDWFIAEYDDLTGRAYGLVNGGYLEYGDIDINEVMDACPDAKIVEGFEPIATAEIFKLYR